MNSSNASTSPGDAKVLIVSPLSGPLLNFGIAAMNSSASCAIDQDANVVGNTFYISGAQKAVFDVTGYASSDYAINGDFLATMTSGNNNISAALGVCWRRL
jgi:hypothetical protein